MTDAPAGVLQWIGRDEWGARPPKATVPLAASVAKVFHHSTGLQLGNPDHRRWVQGIQNFHMDVRGWNDIAYSFLVDDEGWIFEGRGWGLRHAANGVPDSHPLSNMHTHSICYLGDTNLEFTHAAAWSMRWLAEEHLRRYGGPDRNAGHRDCTSTDCPGSMLYAWVQAGLIMPNDAPPPDAVLMVPGGGGVAQIPGVTPPPQPDTFVEDLVAKMPTLRQGDSGYPTRKLQGLLQAASAPCPIDGIFGPVTVACLKGFQENHGLPDDAVCGPDTWTQLLLG